MMLVFTIHAGIYGSCWYLRFMLVFMVHVGIYDSCLYLWFMLVFTIHAGTVEPVLTITCEGRSPCIRRSVRKVLTEFSMRYIHIEHL